MANLKEVRIRIASVSSTQQITSAMKMVSASKLRKAQNAILKLRPYEAKLTEIFKKGSASIEINTPYSEECEVKNALFIIISSNKGLCSSFNSNVIKKGVAEVQKFQKRNPSAKVSIICIGKRATEFFKKNQYNVINSYDYLLDLLTFSGTLDLASSLMSDFEKKKYDRISVVYNKFKNAATQILSTDIWLPMQLNNDKESIQICDVDYLFQPNKNAAFENLIPLLLKTQFYKFLLESSASEHGSRMVAMQTASDNANSLIKELKLSYNKARQTGITNELIEIVSGANALNG